MAKINVGEKMENFVFDKDTMFYQEDDVTDENLKKAWEALLQDN